MQHNTLFQVVTPKKFKDVYLYDNPHGLIQSTEAGEFYDVPRTLPVHQVNSPSPNNMAAENYDIPRPLVQLTPSSSASSLTTDSLNSSNRSSFVNIPDYDIPKPHAKNIAQIYDIPNSQQRLKELPLEINCALETFEKLHVELISAINRILQLTAPSTTKSKDKLDTYLMDIKVGVMRVKTALHDFTEFSERVLGNAAKVSDKTLISKLLPLVQSLKKSDTIIGGLCEKLQDPEWYKQKFTSCAEEDKLYKLDEFEELIICSRALTEEIRQIASFIQGNAPLLFRKNSQEPSIIQDDYDYVNLDTKEAVSKQHADFSAQLPVELRKKYDHLVESADISSFEEDKQLSQNEKDILVFYASQAVTHHKNLTQAIDAFLQTVEHNQPPKVFLAHGKFVVLSAHKLVSIGDAVHRSVTRSDLKLNTLNSANALSAALAATVAKTKLAAMQFPSVTAVQEMVDSVVDISHSARDIKLCLLQATQPYY